MSYSLDSIFNLHGRTALVTGSSRGIGASIARGLAAAGANVFLHGQTAGSAAKTEQLIKDAGGQAQVLSGNLLEAGQGRALIKQCEQKTGGLDILVVNASAQINDELADITDEDLSFQLDVNLRSTIEMLQTCLPLMAERGWGRVVNIGSINQANPKSIVTAYAAIKAAQHNIIQSQARHYAQTGVVLNTLSPGLIDTDRAYKRKTENPDEWAAYTKQVNWMGRAGEPHEMVGAALLLSSDACSFMTGEVITLSGGV